MRPSQHRYVRPFVCRLEDRTVPSAVKTPPVDRGDFFYAMNDRVALLERVGEFAIGLVPGSAIQDVLDSAPFAGMQVEQQIDAATYIVQGSLAVGPTKSGVRWVSPLFEGVESEHWLTPTNEVIVALAPGVNAGEFFAGDTRFTGYRPLAGTPDQFLASVAAGSGRAVLDLANELQNDSRLQWASPNFYQDWQKFYTPNDPLLNQQWHLNNTGQNGSTPNADVDAPEAWNVTAGGSPNIVIAIVDDGVEYTHPDLMPNLFTNVGEIAGNGVDDDANGWVDDVHGWDFTANDNDPGPSSAADEHGTATSGIAAATGDNGLGVAGIAYRSQFFPSRIFAGSSATSDANIASALYYAAGRTANGLGSWRSANVVSNSWGGGANSAVINAALSWAGINGRTGKGTPMLFATGNGFSSSISQPAVQAGAYGNVIAVGASNDLNVHSDYSNYGPQIDFLAPSDGGNFGTVTTDRVGANGFNASGDYTNTAASAFGGTSSATPLAAGIAALILARDGSLTAAQVRGLMRGTTDYISPGTAAYGATTGFSSQYGYGKVNAFTAVSNVGVAEVQVLNGAADVASNSTNVAFSAGVGSSQSVTLRVRNQGTQTLTLGSINLPSGPFSVVNSFGNVNLSVGQSTTFTVQFSPTATGVVQQNLTFTTNDNDEGTFTIILRGQTPTTFVTGSTPNSANPPISSVTFAFSAPMDMTSFSVADDVVSFTGPAGNLLQYVSGYQWVTGTQLRVDFAAQTIPGAYSLVLGPQLLDLGGLALDQNRNGIPGESPGDRFVASFNSGATGAGNTFGYRSASQAYDSSFNIQPGGAGVALIGGASNGDDVFAAINIGTSVFRFYGSGVYTGASSVFVNSNGHLSFGSGVAAPTSYSNVALNAADAMTQAAIAPLWDDLHTGRNTVNNDVVLYQLRDTSGDNVPDLLVINWRNVHYYNGSSLSDDGITFQAVMQINTGASPGTITFNYTDLDDGSGIGGASGQNRAASATIGIKSTGTGAAAADALQLYLNNTPAVPSAPFAVRIFKNSAPTANANGPYSVAAGASVVLSSAGSSDPDPNDTLTYIWDLDGDGTYGETGALALRGDETGAAPTFNAAGLTAGAYPIALRVLNPSGFFADATATVNVTGTSAPTVVSVIVGDGAIQRSTVGQLTVAFDQVISFAGLATDAFTLKKAAGGTVALAVNTTTVAGHTEATLTFLSDTTGVSLNDGRYTLVVNASQILAGTTPMAADSTTNFLRFFGDANGDARIDIADFAYFSTTYNLNSTEPGFISYFDYNNDTRIDIADFAQFSVRLYELAVS